jgi:two-component system phosphate regulon sensor histidine kinase PhoR
MRLRNRIFSTYLVVSFVLVAVVGALLYRAVIDAARVGFEDRLATTVQILTVELGRMSTPAEESELDVYIDALARAAAARVTIVAPDGRVAADSEFDGPELAALDNHNSRAEVIAARRLGTGESTRYSRSLGTDLVYRAHAIDAGPWAGSVARVAIPRTRIQAAESNARRRLFGALALALALAGVTGALWARRLSLPIKGLKEAAEQVRDGQLEARVDIRTGDEIEELAQALDGARNQLANRIQSANSERDQLEAVLDGMVEGVMVTDANGTIVIVNPALRTLFGLESPAVGHTVIAAIRQPAVAAIMEETAARNTVMSREITITYPMDRIIALYATKLSTGGVAGVFHDVTALKRTDAVRRDFVANVSHELQTPLATLSAHAESLAGADLSSNQAKESLAAIQRQVGRLSALVADLLELSRIESDGFEPVWTAVDVNALVDDLASEWRPRAGESGQALAVESEPELVVTGDRRLLRQAVVNLLENAIKYAGEAAHIRLIARRVNGDARIEVADTGRGIPIEDQSRLFERFYRVEKGRTRVAGGTGLGLSIVKHVAEVHGGSVAVESTPGAGAKFVITIPTSQTDPNLGEPS